MFVSVAEIDWIEAANYYTWLHVGPNTHLLLAALERELQSGPFCRIHRSTIVNVDRIRSLELMDDGEYGVVMKTGIRLRLSRGFRKSLRHRLGLRRAWQPVGLGDRRSEGAPQASRFRRSFRAPSGDSDK